MAIKILFLILSLHINLINCLYSSTSSVVILRPDNFDKLVINSNDLWIVEFFAPWCGHCKQFASEFNKAAEALKGVIKVGAVDASEHQSLGSRFNVQGFPTVKIFGSNKASPVDYNGQRTARGLIDTGFDHLKRMIDSRVGGGGGGGSKSGKSNVIEVTDQNFAQVVLQSKEPFLLEFFAPWCGHCKNLEPIWKTVADEVKEENAAFKIGAIDATEHTVTANKYGIKGFPTIKLFIDGNVEDYEGGRSKSDILNFIHEKLSERQAPPEVVQLINNDLLEDNCASKQLCIISFLPHILDCNAECRNEYLSILNKMAEAHKKFGYLWAEALQQPELENSLGIGGFGYPAMAALNFRKMKYSTLRGSFSKEGIHEFLRDLSYGKGSSVPVPKAKLPSLETVEPWDGKDGEMPSVSDEL